MKNQTNNIIEKMSLLPAELQDIIREYLPKYVLAFTNKQNYILYHSFIHKTIPRYDNYVRNTIRNDHIFVFEFIVKENYKKWLNQINYNYQNIIFNTYLSFIIHYCIENNSNKCKNFLYDYIKNHGLCKNQHKKNIINHIRWKN